MMRSVALRARGFSASSSAEAVIGLRVTALTVAARPHTHTGKDFGQTHGSISDLKVFLTTRSSSE